MDGMKIRRMSPNDIGAACTVLGLIATMSKAEAIARMEEHWGKPCGGDTAP